MENKKDFCCSNIQFLSKNDYIEIGSILIEYNLKNHIKECSSGCIVDLNLLDDKIIDKIYNNIKNKISNLEYK